VSIYNRRNALVGFVAIKVIQRRLRRRKRTARKALVFGGLGLLSVGALVGVGAVLVKRQRGEARHLEGYAEVEEAESAIVGEPDTASSEPIPAT
jgi:hypothetical protein